MLHFKITKNMPILKYPAADVNKYGCLQLIIKVGLIIHKQAISRGRGSEVDLLRVKVRTLEKKKKKRWKELKGAAIQ